MEANMRKLEAPPEAVFGNVIKGLRKSEHVAQKQLAELSGVSASALSRIESGETNPTLTTIVGLAKGLNLKPSELMTAFDEALELVERQLEENAPAIKIASTIGAGGIAAAGLARIIGGLIGATVASKFTGDGKDRGER